MKGSKISKGKAGDRRESPGERQPNAAIGGKDKQMKRWEDGEARKERNGTEIDDEGTGPRTKPLNHPSYLSSFTNAVVLSAQHR